MLTILLKKVKPMLLKQSNQFFFILITSALKQMVNQIYHIELQLNGTSFPETDAPLLDLRYL